MREWQIQTPSENLTKPCFKIKKKSLKMQIGENLQATVST